MGGLNFRSRQRFIAVIVPTQIVVTLNHSSQINGFVVTVAVIGMDESFSYVGKISNRAFPKSPDIPVNRTRRRPLKTSSDFDVPPSGVTVISG